MKVYQELNELEGELERCQEVSLNRSETVGKRSLGNTTENVSAFQERRARRYRLQALAGALLPEERVSWCMHMASHFPVYQKVNKQGQSYYKNLAVCGSVWVCPICSSRISEKRRAELEEALLNGRGAGLKVVLITLTLAHSREDHLSGLMTELNSVFRRLKAGRWWLNFKKRFGVRAYVTSLEITYGLENGFHPHKHMLVFMDTGDQVLPVEEIKGELSVKWSRMLEKEGRYASELYGIDVRAGDNEVGSYVSKFGLASEVTRSVVKDGRDGFSMWQLLDRYSSGDKWAGKLFQEYAEATRGLKQLCWSHKGREAVGLGEDLGDQEAAEEEEAEEDQVLHTYSQAEWRLVLKNDARVVMLQLGENGGSEAITRYLEKLREKSGNITEAVSSS